MVISRCLFSTGIGALFCLVGKSLNLCHPFYLQTACKVYKSKMAESPALDHMSTVFFDTTPLVLF
jgi:hypothetical protein